MARKKIELSLTPVEVDHLAAAIDTAQAKHRREMGRENAALTRVSAKLSEAEVSQTGTPADEDEQDGD